MVYWPERQTQTRQNGLAGNTWGTVIGSGMSMLKHSKQGKSDWIYAVKNAETAYNMLPKECLQGRSPDEVESGEKPDVSKLRTFGCDAFVRVPNSRRRKGGDKAEACTFLYYKDGVKPGWTFRTQTTGRNILSSDAIFYEGDWLPNGIQKLGALFQDQLAESAESGNEVENPHSDDDDSDDEEPTVSPKGFHQYFR